MFSVKSTSPTDRNNSERLQQEKLVERKWKQISHVLHVYRTDDKVKQLTGFPWGKTTKDQQAYCAEYSGEPDEIK